MVFVVAKVYISNEDKRLRLIQAAKILIIIFSNEIQGCLTFSHGSEGSPTLWNETSAKAGCFSAALQLKFRSFPIQDTDMFCGASYLTAEERGNVLLHCNIICKLVI